MESDASRHPTTLAHLLREGRLRVGLTQAALAERAGLSIRTIEHLESGRGKPFAHSAIQLADALGLTADARAQFLEAARRAPKAGVTTRGWRQSKASARSNPRTTLPIALTSFVGRERELAEIRRLLDTSRLLTLTGPGGVGKTRLAIEAIRGGEGRDSDDVYSLDLAPLSDDRLVPQVVASTLGVPEQSTRPALEVLVDALSMRRVLLVLDNCEHLVLACAALADAVLRNCPDVRILATSRQPLGVRGETIWRVPALTESEAMRLFVDRAQAVVPEWILTKPNMTPVAQVCQRLDGIPLAIEFAAARVAVLAPTQIAERLADRFALLTATSRGSPPRHQTLRATLDWSYGLLAPDEQLLFDRLSVFAGDLSLEAAETVCAGDHIQPRRVLDLLQQLVEQSLVLAVHPEDGPARFRLLETLREYGRERLEDRDEADAIQHRHAEFFLALAEANEPELFGARWMAAQATFAREQDNIRAALRWLLSRGDFERAQRFAGSVARFWFFHGYFEEGSAWLAQVLALTPAVSTVGRAKSLHGVGTIAMMRGGFAEAESALREALSIWRELGNRSQQGFVLFVLGMVARQRGARVEARRLFEEGLAASRAAASAPPEANNLAGLADVARDQRQYAKARRYGEEALKCASAAGYLRGEVHALRALGEVTYEMGDYGAATELLEAGLVRSRQLGAQWLVAWTLARLGLLAIQRDEYAEAEALLAESLALCRDMGDRQGIARCLEGFAQLAGLQQRPETALRLASAAEQIRMAFGVPLSPMDRSQLEQRLAAARAMLGQSAADTVWIEARRLSLQDALALALMPATAHLLR